MAEEGRRREEEEGSAIVLDSFEGEGFGVVFVGKKFPIELGGASTD